MLNVKGFASQHQLQVGRQLGGGQLKRLDQPLMIFVRPTMGGEEQEPALHTHLAQQTPALLVLKLDPRRS